MSEQWAPWSTDPDDPRENLMTQEEIDAASRRVVALDYNPNHHPAGSPKGGQFAPKEGGSEASERAAEDVNWSQSGMTPESREKALDEIQKDLSKAVPPEEDDQPTDDVDLLIDLANKAEPVFKETIEKIAKLVNGQSVYPPKTAVKGKARILEKAQLDYGGKVSEVKDMLRATIQTETIEDARIAAQTFIARMGENVLRVKDKIISVDRGYRDILINFRTENGIVSEVQFNARPMIREKFGEGHKLYEEIRSKPNMDPAEVMRLTNRMNEIYDAAYDEAGDSKWLRSKGQ